MNYILTIFFKDIYFQTGTMSQHNQRPFEAVINELNAAIDAWTHSGRQSEREVRYELRCLRSALERVNVEVYFGMYRFLNFLFYKLVVVYFVFM